jgi:hypothetical protein
MKLMGNVKNIFMIDLELQIISADLNEVSIHKSEKDCCVKIN